MHNHTKAPVVPVIDPTLSADLIDTAFVAELCDADRFARRRWTDALPARAAVRLYGRSLPSL